MKAKNEKDSWCHFIWFFILGTWSSSWLILYKTEQNWPAASTHWGKGRANLETRSIGANLILLATHYLLHFGSIRHCKKGLIFILFHWSGHRHGFFSIFLKYFLSCRLLIRDSNIHFAHTHTHTRARLVCTISLINFFFFLKILLLIIPEIAGVHHQMAGRADLVFFCIFAVCFGFNANWHGFGWRREGRYPVIRVAVGWWIWLLPEVTDLSLL